jgi:hypothetical protein
MSPVIGSPNERREHYEKQRSRSTDFQEALHYTKMLDTLDENESIQKLIPKYIEEYTDAVDLQMGYSHFGQETYRNPVDHSRIRKVKITAPNLDRMTQLDGGFFDGDLMSISYTEFKQMVQNAPIKRKTSTPV